MLRWLCTFKLTLEVRVLLFWNPNLYSNIKQGPQNSSSVLMRHLQPFLPSTSETLGLHNILCHYFSSCTTRKPGSQIILYFLDWNPHMNTYLFLTPFAPSLYFLNSHCSMLNSRPIIKASSMCKLLCECFFIFFLQL